MAEDSLLQARGLLAVLACLSLSIAGMCRAQNGGMSGGIASGVSAAPVYDAEKRPITAGGFVDTGTVVFEDIARQAGLSLWRHKMGGPEKNFIVETNGSGVALLDYDNDGWLDIYLVNGSTFNALDGKEEPPHAALFRNNHDGTFTDVAGKAGVAIGNWSTGSSWGDYDGDGLLDLAERESRPSSLGGVEAGGLPEKPSGRHLRHGLPCCQWYAPAPGCDVQRQLYLLE
jgi:hypothetical protein